MKHVSIGTATRIYETTSKCVITRHWVDHEGLADVSHSLRSLVRSLGSEAMEEFWLQVLRPIRRLTFNLYSTPLPFHRAATAACIDWTKINRQVRFCQQLYPDSHINLTDLVQKLQRLCTETGSPFTAPLEWIVGKTEALSVLLHNTRLNETVVEYFSETAALCKANVVSLRQLREAHPVDVLLAIGPCRWFPNYVFSAPRALSIHVVSFRWIPDPWKFEPLFPNVANFSVDKSYKHYVGKLPQLRAGSIPLGRNLSELDPVDLLPFITPYCKTEPRLKGWKSGVGDEMVPARLCYLTSYRAVFVSADEGAKSLVIDTTEEGDSIVKRVPSAELEPELYLLLRTSGGGDYITPFADRIMGPLADERRKQQAEWKGSLIAAAQKQFGLLSRRELASKVASLRLPNLSEARPANIHYWMSSKCIHPQKEEDFRAVLAFAGLSDRVQELWEAMQEIVRAHKKAGQMIRRMLLQKIKTTSLEPLERDGEMTFDLGEQDGGTLSAFQIMSISKGEIEIPADHIGQLLDLEE